jgi:elongation of very long chain fatty acids protein 6
MEFFTQYKVYADDPEILLNRPETRHALPWISVILYLIMLVTLPKIVGKKPIPGIKFIMAVWNFGLAVLSLLMFIGIVVPLYQNFMNFGIYATLCGENGVSYTDKPIAICFWGYLFILSKFVELFDTVWMILNGKPVELLHWWHHVSVLLFTWYASVWQTSVGWCFSSMNALVHTFMYTYYFLMAIGYKPTWAKLLTLGQITQMIIGTALNIYYFYHYAYYTCTCKRPDLMMVACGIMYGSYLILFVKFYLNRYVYVKPKSEKTDKTQQEKKDK